MKISLNWLADFVSLDGYDAQQIAELLSLHTAEVEGVETFGEAIQDVIVGEVLRCERHPDADKLSVTTVSFGQDEPVPVVCGAPNVRAGLKVAFAPVGSRLPGDLKIKKAKLRGQVSAGMICSERELDLSEEHQGIWELPADAPVGTPLIDYLSLRDSVLEIDNKSLTHRPDLWGHYGFARELAALLQRPLAPLDCAVDWPQQNLDWQIQRENMEACPQYGIVALDLAGSPMASSGKIRNRLLAVGQRLIHDVVDLSNYVMLEIGQPTHAFDLACLPSKKVVVRQAKDGETLRTLDGVERELSAEDLLICAGEEAVALAGVMGGEKTEVTSSTQQILLESAVFHPTRVRRTAHRLALRSEASARFEKSLDPAYANLARDRFCHLLLAQRPDAKILAAPLVDGEAPVPSMVLPLDLARACKLLGLELVEEEVVSLLTAMGFACQPEDGGYQVQVPSWRATKDVTLAIDLIEEVGRMHGYHRIQAQALHAPVKLPQQRTQRKLVRLLGQRLVLAHGAYETQSYSFLHRDWAQRLQLEMNSFVRTENPVQAQVDLVRRHPLPSLIEQAASNLREREEGRLFEFAKGYEPHCPSPVEKRWLGLVEWGRKQLPQQGAESLFGHVRSVVLDLLQSRGLDASALRILPQEESMPQPDWAHPVQCLHWYWQDVCLGHSGRVHPRLLADFDFDHHHCAAFLLDMDALEQAFAAGEVHFQAPSRFPAIKVDVALALPSSLPYAEVEAQLRQVGGPLLEALELFDVYTGPGLEEGQRSLAFRCLLRAPDRTLSDKEEQKFLRKVEKAAAEMGGNLRS